MNVRRHPFSAVIAVAVIIFLWSPLVIVAINSVNRDVLLASWKGATTKWYHQAYYDHTVRSGLHETLVVAAATTVLSLVLAVTAALWWRRASPRARRLFDGLTYLRIMLPEVVFAVALFLLFSRLNFPLGTTAIVIGHTVWNSAYATLIVQARVSTLDPALEDAAADLGANPWRTFRRVIVPGLLPAIAAAGLLAFTFSFDDVVTSYFLTGAGTDTLPVVLLSMIRFRITPEINAVGMLVMLFTVSMFTLGFVVVTRLGRGARRALALPEARRS
jgi:ABC-type spermidine/putrescine transport system permease subunit II